MKEIIITTLTISSLITVILIGCDPTTVKRLSKESLKELLSKRPEEWTYEECESIIQCYTSFNKKGYHEKFSDRSYTTENVFIKATPLNKNVINAIVRKEAIQKRLPLSQYRERLKEYLESYTNFTLNIENGEIINKQCIEDTPLEGFYFKVYFENISLPHRTIEIDGAYDGFFLENTDGEFSRVIEISGYEIDEYFVLVSDLNAIITFSAFTDDGKRLDYDENTIKKFKLIFNGLQSKPIIIDWKNFLKKYDYLPSYL